MHRNFQDTTGAFAVIENGANLQTAVRRLEPREASGPFGNGHGQSKQVLPWSQARWRRASATDSVTPAGVRMRT
jgi:hypothetical protein